MTITEVHKLICEATGEMSLAIVRREAEPTTIANWVRRLRIAADALEERLKQPKEPAP